MMLEMMIEGTMSGQREGVWGERCGVGWLAGMKMLIGYQGTGIRNDRMADGHDDEMAG